MLHNDSQNTEFYDYTLEGNLAELHCGLANVQNVC